MEKEVQFRDRVRYWVDNTFSKGTIALIAWLAVISLIVVTIAASLLAVTGFNQEGVEGGLNFGEAAWEAMMRTFDAGTMGGDTGWGFRWIMLFVTLGGVFVISTLIGVLTAGVEGKIEELRKGRSRVIESGQTVILGWTEQIYTIFSELGIAFENQKSSSIVVLAEKDKVEMEDDIRERIGKIGRTKIVCRSGSPIDMNDLSIVSLNTSRSILVLSPEGDYPDSEVIKTILAITRHPNRRKQPYHIVAELRDLKNAEIGRVVGQDEVEWVMSGDLVARIIAQTCRQSGLSVVYNELLDFGGDEIYFTQPADLVGKTYAESLDRFESNTVMGISQADGSARLNPPLDTVLQAEDKLVVIAADDDQIFYNPGSHPAPQSEQIAEGRASPAQPEKTLILGWNWRLPMILRELDSYVAPGSEVLVVADVEESLLQAPIALANQTVLLQPGDTTERTLLEKLVLGGYQHIILLSYLEGISPQQADSRTLISLLHLRDLSDRHHLDFSITSEMMDLRNRNLAEVTGADDFIVSGRLISLMLAQISENKYINAVFADLFDPEGSEVYLKPVERYLTLGQAVNFYTVLESARQKGETAIGYRRMSLAGDASQAYGVRINPKKSEMVAFQPGDKIIVLAES